MNGESFRRWFLKRRERGGDAEITEAAKNLRVLCEKLCALCVSKKQPPEISQTLQEAP